MPLVDRPEPKLKPWLVAAALTSGSADTAAWCSPNMPVWSSLVPLGRASSLLGRLNWAKTLSLCSLFSGYNFWRSSRPRRTCGSTRGGTCRRCRLSWCRGCCRCPVNCGRLDILPFFASKYYVNTVQWRFKKKLPGVLRLGIYGQNAEKKSRQLHSPFLSEGDTTIVMPFYSCKFGLTSSCEKFVLTRCYQLSEIQ